ncbi:MAG: VC0807 family protein [Acidimicrobiia bacterium]
MATHTLETPRLRSLARQGLPAIVEGTIMPLAIFYAALWALGMWGALIAALTWSYLAIARRIVKKQAIPGLVLLSALALTFRTVLAMVTGSVFIYFLQPSLVTALLGFAFLASMTADQPLVQRLARDFLPVSPDFFTNPFVRHFFMRISLLWAMAMLANAGVTTWMLFRLPVSVFVISKTGASVVLTGVAIAYSIFWFRRLFTPSPDHA